MKVPLYQIDAFTDTVFKGNPAAVCPLDRWLPDASMQSIAAENNLAETAFFVPRPAANGAPRDYDLRWFTPEAEIDLCGHATLASAYLVFTVLEPGRDSVTFHSQSGPLTVARAGGRLAMDFPSRPPVPIAAPAGLIEALGATPREVGKARDILAVFESEDQVRALKPAFDGIRALGVFGVIVTAPGRDVDFVSRFFAPLMGVPEDPVTGSSHCTLVPYWAKRLGKRALHARQISPRGGDLWCEDRGDRVLLAGHAVQYLEGAIEV
ncbi:MAG TPA: PhzF family phenazine biosynthesis protein [Candidatus Eisenbacteria bacterium]|nr:PhzF family phenazine biosynthesis protein [Candidatus Eisenbacteria bacterium]